MSQRKPDEDDKFRRKSEFDPEKGFIKDSTKQTASRKAPLSLFALPASLSLSFCGMNPSLEEDASFSMSTGALVTSAGHNKNSMFEQDVKDNQVNHHVDKKKKGNKKLQLAPPVPRYQRPPSSAVQHGELTTEVAGGRQHGTISVSSWEARFPEPMDEESSFQLDEQSDPHQPGAHRVPGVHGGHDDVTTVDDYTAADHDTAAPPTDPCEPGPFVCDAEVVEPTEVVEAQEIEDQSKGFFGNMSVRNRLIFVGIGLLAVVGLVLGLLFGLSRPDSSLNGEPKLMTTTRPTLAPSPAPTSTPLSGVWNQIGDTLIGGADYDGFGLSVALSGNGSIVAVGAVDASPMGQPGYVRVYQTINGTAWTQLGGDLVGLVNSNERFGSAVSLSDDGTVLAVDAPGDDSNGVFSGQIRVYKLMDNEWVRIGNPINGRGMGDTFGSALSLSADGTIVAAGCGIWFLRESGEGYYAAVYQLQNGDWKQIGSDLPGYSYSVSLSHDGAVLAVGGFPNQVQVYRWVNNAWTIIGSPITGTDSFGDSVSLSADGKTVATGDPGGSYAAVYHFSNDDWTRVGSIVDGENFDDGFGSSVSLSNDGTVLAVGAPYYWSYSNGGEFSGQVNVFQLVNDEWTPIGDPINGSGGDTFGVSLALSADGRIVAGGATQYFKYENETANGYAVIHRLEEQ